MKGPLVKEWTWNLKEWLEKQYKVGVDKENDATSMEVETMFKNMFSNSLTEDRTCQEMKKLWIDVKGLDHYIAWFKELARMAGYNVKKENILLEQFIDGLPTWLAAEVMAKNDPKTYEDWKKGTGLPRPLPEITWGPGPLSQFIDRLSNNMVSLITYHISY